MQTRNLLSFLFVTIVTFGCNSNCKDVGCNDAGYCYDGACICDKWYNGESCSLLFNRHYEGTYISEANQMARIGIDSLIIQPDQNIANRITSLNGPFMDFVTDSTLAVPLQEIYINSQLISIQGKGKFGSDFISFDLKGLAALDSRKADSIVYSFTRNRLK